MATDDRDLLAVQLLDDTHLAVAVQCKPNDLPDDLGLLGDEFVLRAILLQPQPGGCPFRKRLASLSLLRPRVPQPLAERLRLLVGGCEDEQRLDEGDRVLV